MKRSRRTGGFHCLMSMAGALSLLRLALAALSLCSGSNRIALCAMLLLLTLPLDFFGHRLTGVYGLATVHSLILDALADFAVAAAALRLLVRCWEWLQIPAGFMLLLSLAGLIVRICKAKRTAV